MAITSLSDIGQLPQNISDYILQESTARSAFFQSGIMRTDVTPEVQALLNAGGKTVVFPFFNDLTGSGQILDESTDLVVGKVTTGTGVAPVLERAEVWGSNDLVADFLGEDPMRLIADRVANFWTRHYQTMTLSMLSGSLGSVTANVLDISALTGGAELIDADSVIDAQHLLGDRATDLAAIAIHSRVLASLRKQNLIDYIQPSEGGPRIPTYQGLTVIVDDGMTVSNGVYTTYLFARGSVLWGQGTVKTPEEIDRNSLKSGGQEWLVSRKRFMAVPTGVSWTPANGVPAALTPSNAELAASGNWTRVFDQKNIGIVKFVHKVA